MMPKTNKEKVIKISVQGEIQHPGRKGEFITDCNGDARVLPATGGIVYNAKVGDCCMDLAADHLEPGVTTHNSINDLKRNGYSVYSCIGNEAKVVTGDAKGAKGFVTGQHDMPNVLIYFDEAAQVATINRFWDSMGAHSYLYIGHSESLFGMDTKFEFLKTAWACLYQKTVSSLRIVNYGKNLSFIVRGLRLNGKL